MQIWKIKGQTYNIGQLRELRKNKIDPVKDQFVAKFEKIKEDSTKVESVDDFGVDSGVVYGHSLSDKQVSISELSLNKVDNTKSKKAGK